MKGTKSILLFFAVCMSLNIYSQEIIFKKQPLKVKSNTYDSLKISDEGEAQVEIGNENHVQGEPDTLVLIGQDSTEASFPGDDQAWLWYIVKNLDLRVVYNDGVRAGSYQVTVRFNVDERGKVGNVKAIEVPKACAICGREAERVVKRGPIWVAATKDGRPVASQVTRRITFQVGGN